VLYAKCRILHESIGCVRIEISYGGSDYVQVMVSLHIDNGRVYDTRWGSEMNCLPISQVSARFATAHEHADRVQRVIGLLSPLAPLFTDDKLKWMLGITELERLEMSAGEAPARREVIA
jgi:hypothetical protein